MTNLSIPLAPRSKIKLTRIVVAFAVLASTGFGVIANAGVAHGALMPEFGTLSANWTIASQPVIGPQRISAASSSSSPGLLISEVLADPTGTDKSFEFVELIATKAIDFSVTPYSVVFTSNGTATAAGWVRGGSITYGFNITTGTVITGNVVYVGGSTMTATGTKLRVIDIENVAGDGFGSIGGNGGVLGQDTGSADSVGVFEVGISALTSSTVPIDAIFFGVTQNAAVVNSGADGYQLPVNDRIQWRQASKHQLPCPQCGHGSIFGCYGAI